MGYNCKEYAIKLQQLLENVKTEKADKNEIKAFENIFRESAKVLFDTIGNDGNKELLRTFVSCAAYFLNQETSVKIKAKRWRKRRNLSKTIFDTGLDLNIECLFTELGIDYQRLKESVVNLPNLRLPFSVPADLSLCWDIIVYLVYQFYMLFEILYDYDLIGDVAIRRQERSAALLLSYLNVDDNYYKTMWSSEDNWVPEMVSQVSALQLYHSGATEPEMPLGVVCAVVTTILYNYMTQSFNENLITKLLEIVITNTDGYINSDYLMPGGRMYYCKIVGMWWLNKLEKGKYIEQVDYNESPFVLSKAIECAYNQYVYSSFTDIKIGAKENFLLPATRDKIMKEKDIGGLIDLMPNINKSFQEYMNDLGYDNLYLYVKYNPMYIEEKLPRRMLTGLETNCIINATWCFVREREFSKSTHKYYITVVDDLKNEVKCLRYYLKEQLRDMIENPTDYARATLIYSLRDFFNVDVEDNRNLVLKLMGIPSKDWILDITVKELLKWLKDKTVDTLEIKSVYDLFCIQFLTQLDTCLEGIDISIEIIARNKPQVTLFYTELKQNIKDLKKLANPFLEDINKYCSRIKSEDIYFSPDVNVEKSDMFVYSFLQWQSRVFVNYNCDAFRLYIRNTLMSGVIASRLHLTKSKAVLDYTDTQAELLNLKRKKADKQRELEKQLKAVNKELREEKAKSLSQEKKLTEYEEKAQLHKSSEGRIQKLTTQNNVLQKERDSLLEQIAKYERRIQQEENRLAKYREKLSNLSETDIVEDIEDETVELSYEDMKKAITGKRILFISGLSTLSHIEEELDIKFLHFPKNKNMTSILTDISVYDCVMIETGHIAHSRVEYITSLNKSNKTQIGLIDSTNTKRICKGIYEFCVSKGVL